ncbi:hypothetical protein FXB78_10735 [Aggregatibacter actinomycetemcomitans]|uniref:hypothetical protein n=2 Tax=Aggregatibacter actinomycetemcomitans TaxID=714 RepID=UPI0011D9D6B3|nr:hypothetical protein [Aggregatibacter actinomycetemcomitans]TYA50246.1 hypothetical protein FXB81_10775 [Aggregatibacter actinomycetemcomitans]TYB26086.1 hypothetical protein FXB78_10735 [Aggregatibacter actinomycetemcomitans]
MKYILLLILSLFTFSNVLAKDINLINPCANINIPIETALTNKGVLLNKEVDIGDKKMFLISYLDSEGNICYDKKYDVFFKVDNVYVYNDKLFNELEEVYPEISANGNMFVIQFEYGNGQSNIERYYLIPESGNIYLNREEIVYSRSGKSKDIKFENISIKNIEFSKLINVY